jgi:ubiquinone/menaquinone biosynthesis C-methylase UbiE
VTSLPRASGAELMDEPGQDPRELARGLADLRRVNRWLGGTRIALARLAALAGRHPRPAYTLLDVATGSADIPLAAVRWARRRGTGLRVVATDLHAGTLREARNRVRLEPAISVVPADARALPFRDRAFDLVLCSTALHHFDDRAELLRVLGEMARVARIGVVVSDLRRSRAAFAGARLLAATLWRRHPVTRHDGPLSVRRALTPDELRELAGAAGLESARVRAHAPFRLALVWERAR